MSAALAAACAPLAAAGMLLAATPGHALGEEIPFADFARHTQYENVKISPAGDYLAATDVVKGKRVLSLIRLADMKGLNLSPHDNDEVADFWWIDTHRVVYSIQEKVGDLDVPLLTGELYAANADGSGRAIIAGVRDYGGFQGIAQVIGRVPGDSKRLLVQTTPWARESEHQFASAQMIDGSGSLQRLATAPMQRANFVADNHGDIRFAYADTDDLGVEVYYRADSSARWELLFDRSKAEAALRPIRFSRNDDSVYFACPGDSGVGGICRWNVETRTMQVLWSALEAEPDQLLDTLDGRDAFAIGSTPGRPALTLIGKDGIEAKLLRALTEQFPGQDVRLGSSTADGRRVVVFVSSDRNPGEFYLLDVDQGKASFLLARQPWIRPERMAAMEPVKLAARDGLPLHGYLTRPAGKETAKNLPMIVLVHGGPYGIHDSWGYDPAVQMLASRGYAVLQVNFRGSSGYGAEFMRAGLREWGRAMQDDVTDATRWAVAEGIADARRVCIFGASYGGYAALEGAVREPDLYRCAIGYVGVYDLRMMQKRGDIPQTLFGKSYLSRALGDDQDDLYERSPVAHADRIKAKVMLVVGGSDLRVPEAQGKAMHAALNAQHIEHEWLYQRNEAHGFYNETHVTELFRSVMRFLDRSIGAAEIDGRR